MSSLKTIFTVNPGTNLNVINGFPDLNNMPIWVIEINFVLDESKPWASLIGNMRNKKLRNFNNSNTKPSGPYITDIDRGWGIWIGGLSGDGRTIHFSGASNSTDASKLEKIQNGFPYKLVVTKLNNEKLLFSLTNIKTTVTTTDTIPFFPMVTVGATWVGDWEGVKSEKFNGSVTSIIVFGLDSEVDRCNWRANNYCIFRDYNGNNVSGCVAPDPAFNYSGLNSYDSTKLSEWLNDLYIRDGGNATVKASQNSERYNVYDYYNRCKDYVGYDFLRRLNFNNPYESVAAGGNKVAAGGNRINIEDSGEINLSGDFNIAPAPVTTRIWNVKWESLKEASFILYLGKKRNDLLNEQSKQALHFNIKTDTTVINTFDGSNWDSPHVEVPYLHGATRPMEFKVTFNITTGFIIEYQRQAIATIPNRFKILNANDLNVSVTNSYIIVTEPKQRVYSMIKDIDYNNSNIRVHSSQTVDSCKTLCDSENNCAGFIYNLGQKSCYLKTNKVSNPTVYKDLEYYYTGFEPPTPVPAPAPAASSPNPVATPFVQSNVSSITTPIVGTNAYSSDYLNLVGNLKLRGSSIVDGNLIINNNGNQVAGISNNGDLMLRGGIIFGDNPNNVWRLSADGNNFLIQKSGEQGISITSKGIVTPAPTLNINSWTFPKF